MLKALRRLLRALSSGAGRPGRARPDERREEELSHLVLNVEDYAIFRLDAEGYVRTWNVGAQRMKGYTAQEIIGKHFSVFYPPEAVERRWPEHELERAAAEGRYEEEGWRLRKDGSRFWAYVVITALRDEEGRTNGYLKITRDLTERRAAEERLRLSERRFRLMIDGVLDYAIFLVDPEGIVVSWNEGASRIHGYRSEEMLGRPSSVLRLPEDVQRGLPQATLEKASREGRTEEEGWLVRKDGSRFWASIVTTAVHDAERGLLGFSKVTRDLTARVRAEDEARRLALEEAARTAAEGNAAEAERARSEERRQREQLHVTLASIGDGVIVTDVDGAITFLNPVAEQLTGWSLSAAVGRPLEDVFWIVEEASGRQAENPVRRALAEGLVVGLSNHTLLLTRDGREIPIDDSAAPIRAEDGRVTGVVLVFRDVSEARRAIEERLRLAAIVESSDDAILGLAPDGTIVTWNQGAERIYGYSAAEILGRPLAVLVPEEHPDEIPGMMEKILSGERIEHFQTVRRHRDGRLIDVSLSVSPIKDPHGQIIGASKIARDVTAERRREDALRFLARASETLAESLEGPVILQRVAGLAVPGFADWCVVDLLQPDGSLQRVALAHQDQRMVERALEIYRRFPPLPQATRGPYHVVRTGEPELITQIPPTILEGDPGEEQKHAVLRELGIESYMSVPLAFQGRMLGVLSFVTAERGRRYGEEDLRLAQDLGRRAAIAIENGRLYAELRAADRRKDEFLAMLAHELRNPLAPIRNALHVMVTPGAEAEMVRRSRDLIERQVEYLVRLVDDLLDVSRIMRGFIELRREPVDLAAVIERAVETAQPAVDAQGQELAVSLPPEPLLVHADPTRLVQVVGNLIQNAAKFSERSGRIRVESRAEGGEAVVRVSDEGAGIPPELLPHVFDLFVQGDRSLERSSGGLGIGLTVARQLVELHGGSITARSEGAGRGSELEVRLPRLAQPERERERRAPSAGAEPPTGGKALRVLVVDDNVDAAESMAMMLRLWGHDVRLAYDGPEALRESERSRPDVIVLDIGLPGMSGYEVAQHLSSSGVRRPILVAVSGYGRAEDRERARDAGFDHHLVKPVDPAELSRVIADVPSRAG